MTGCKEVWKPIEGYEGLYEVSNMGRVKSLKCGGVRILKPGFDNHGYLKVGLYKNGSNATKKIHRLVATHYIPNPSNLPQVNHKKGIKTDNRASELEWVTNRENTSHGKRSRTSRYTGVCWNRFRKKWQAYIGIKNRRKHLGVFSNEKDAAIAYQSALKQNNITNKYAHVTSIN